MSGPRQEILRLLAEGRIAPGEAEMLLDALEEGLGRKPAADSASPSVAAPRSVTRKAGKGSRKKSAASPSQGKATRSRAGSRVPVTGRSPGRQAGRKACSRPTTRRTETVTGKPSSKAPGPGKRPTKGPAAPAEMDVQPRLRNGARAASTPATSGDDGCAGAGRAWDLPPGSTLRIGPPRGGSSVPAGLGLRGVDGNRVRIYRGAGAELRAGEAGSFDLIWDEGILILDIPRDLGGLEILEIQGKVTLLQYAGPFAIEGLAGSLSAGPVRSPFRIRRVGGDIDLDTLSLQGGLSTIADVGGDVRVMATRDASFSVRASSLSGQVAFGRTIAVDSGDPGRRRGVWRLGSGAGQLNITGVKGWIRLFQDSDSGEEQ